MISQNTKIAVGCLRRFSLVLALQVAESSRLPTQQTCNILKKTFYFPTKTTECPCWGQEEGRRMYDVRGKREEGRRMYDVRGKIDVRWKKEEGRGKSVN